MSKKITYRDSGVNIEEGNNFVKAIQTLVSKTSREGADTNLGGFGGIFDLTAYFKNYNVKEPLLVAATDGVGTKLKIAQILSKYDTIGIDLVAMCVNDLIVQGAEPLFFLDYYATGKLEKDKSVEILKGITEGCIQANCGLIGGETAEMPGIYHNDDFDLAGFSVGIVDKSNLLPKKQLVKKSDKFIALPSSGIHSNGYSLVRKIMEVNEISYSAPSPVSPNLTIGDELIKPTEIYVKCVLSLLQNENNGIKAMSHITGGGLVENLPRVLPDDIKINWNTFNYSFPPLFKWLQELAQIDDIEMMTTFNSGVGFVIICDEASAQDNLAKAQKFYQDAFIMEFDYL